MRARDPAESHRASTPLELLFDLCFVVAVAQAASHLHHGLAHGHVLHAVTAFGPVFFAIWWAWMNFTWFASAYDVDDGPYRLFVFVQIAGALTIAAGVPRAFEAGDFGVVTLGYAIARIGIVALWLRASRADVKRGRTARRYACGVAACQVGWLAALLLPPHAWTLAFFALAAAELLVPVWAERGTRTTWHAEHIAERYGLLTLIVLGESVAAATVAIQTSLDAGHASVQLGTVIAGGLLLLFSMWWLYFDRPAHTLLRSSRQAFVWGYGHLLVFASVAAVGAGLGVATEFASGHAELTATAAGLTVAVPVACYLTTVWALHVRPQVQGGKEAFAFLTTVALVLAASASRCSVLLVGVLVTGLVVVSKLLAPISSEDPHAHGASEAHPPPAPSSSERGA